MRDSYKGVPLNGTPEDLRDAIAYFAEQLGFEVVYDEPVPQEEQDKRERMLFSGLFTNLLFTRLYPDEYEFPEEEAGRWICSESRAIFKEYFSGSVGNGEVITIEEEEYKRLSDW